jgi:hypothetical protein
LNLAIGQTILESMKLSTLRYNINVGANALRWSGQDLVPATKLVPSCGMSRNQPKSLTILSRAWNLPTAVPLRHRTGCLSRGGQLPWKFSAAAPMSPTALKLSKIDIFFPILTQEAFSDFVR